MASPTVHMTLPAAGVLAGAAVACVWQATRPPPAVAWCALADIEVAESAEWAARGAWIPLRRSPESPRLTSWVWHQEIPLPSGSRGISRGLVRMPDYAIVDRVAAALDSDPMLWSREEDPTETPGWRRYEFFAPDENYVPSASPGK